MTDINKNGIEFLNRLYRDMYRSEGVMYGIDQRFIGNKTDNIEHYISRMATLHEQVASSGRDNDLRMLKSFYYRKYVIREEDIPESYYEHQKEIHLERGFGHVEFTNDDRHQMAMQIIIDQRKSLDKWIEYFTSKDSDYIPMWAKYWAFQGMLSLGNYNKTNKTFDKRSKGTIAPFADLNIEALALSIDYLLKSLGKEKIDDQQLNSLLQGGSFGKIYTYVLNNVLGKKKNISRTTGGKWVKYKQGSDHMPLVMSLQGYNTGWCTAGEATAKYQLSLGDFYVYYSYNEKREAVVPRIAIRMEHGKIAEVRGVAKNQNIESEMEEIVEEKLNEFPDKDIYLKKTSDMKKLTLIYKKSKTGQELTKEELEFLYGEIQGFGYRKDPRINEIIARRNPTNDLNIIFEGLDCLKTSLDLGDITNVRGVHFPTSIEGSLDLSGLESADGVQLPTSIGGALILSSLKTAEGLQLPTSIGGTLLLSSLKTAEGLQLPTSIGGNLLLGSLRKADGLQLPTSIGGNLVLSGLRKAEGLQLPTSIEGSLDLSGLESAEGLQLPTSIGGNLDLRVLESAEGLQLPTSIGGNLLLGSLRKADGLQLPTSIEGSLDLSGLESAEGLQLPTSIGDALFLSSLRKADGLQLPTSIEESLDLSGLESAEGLQLPTSVRGKIFLYGLANIDGLQLPKYFTEIYLKNNVVITPKLQLTGAIGLEIPFISPIGVKKK